MTKGSQIKGHRVRQYQVIGRKAPTEKEAEPQIFRMKLFATSPVSAKSRFWYFMHQYQKMKKSTGEILSVNEVRARGRKCGGREWRAWRAPALLGLVL